MIEQLGMPTKKDIFSAKLRGDPINVLATNFPILRKFLIECGVCENDGQYQITCKYPLRVFKTFGTGFEIDHLKPGDIYWWA